MRCHVTNVVSEMNSTIVMLVIVRTAINNLDSNRDKPGSVWIRKLPTASEAAARTGVPAKRQILHGIPCEETF